MVDVLQHSLPAETKSRVSLGTANSTRGITYLKNSWSFSFVVVEEIFET